MRTLRLKIIEKLLGDKLVNTIADRFDLILAWLKIVLDREFYQN